MNMKLFAYAFGIMACFTGLVLYNYEMNNDKSILIGAILIVAGCVFMLYSYGR